MTRTPLDRLVSTHGKEMGMQIPSDQQTQANLIRQLGLIYDGGFEAVKEYITNAADAGAREIKLSLKRRPAKPSISISDDGHGMNLPESERRQINSSLGTPLENIAKGSILRLPRSIGNSIRAGDATTQGKKAIGALAWQILANGIDVVSKQNGEEPVGWTCNYVPKSDGKASYNAFVIPDGIPSRTVSGRQGTVITLKDVNKDRMKELLPNKLQERIGSMFRDLLLSGMKITINDDKTNQAYIVKPEEYHGARLINKTVETVYGPIAVDIYINPNQSSVVRVKQGIQTLVNDISTQRAHLVSAAWGSGMLTGQVKADWIEPDASREGIQMDDKARVFYEELRRLNPELETAVRDYKKSLNPMLNQAMYGAMTRALRKVVEENPDIAELFSGYRKSNKGKKTPGQPVDGYALPLPGETQTGNNGSGNGTGSGSGAEGTNLDPDGGKPIDPNLPGTTKAKKGITLRFDEEEMPPHILSRFEEESSVIVFNNAARPYMEASRDPSSKRVYLAGLVGKELMGKMYKEPRELTDNVIKFQMAFVKYIPTN